MALGDLPTAARFEDQQADEVNRNSPQLQTTRFILICDLQITRWEGGFWKIQVCGVFNDGSEPDADFPATNELVHE